QRLSPGASEFSIQSPVITTATRIHLATQGWRSTAQNPRRCCSPLWLNTDLRTSHRSQVDFGRVHQMGSRPERQTIRNASRAQSSPRDRTPLLVIDAQDQEFVRMTLVVDPEWRHAPTPDNRT